LGPGCVAAAVRGGFQRGAQVIDLGLHRGAVDLKHVAAGLQPGFKYGHGGWPLLCLLPLEEGAPKGRMRIRAKPGARKPMVTPARVLVPVQLVPVQDVAGAGNRCFASCPSRLRKEGSTTRSAGTVRGRSACGGSPKCRRRSRTAWHRATGVRPDTR